MGVKCSAVWPCTRCASIGADCVFVGRGKEKLRQKTKELDEANSTLSSVYDSLRNPDGNYAIDLQQLAKESRSLEDFQQRVSQRVTQAGEELFASSESMEDM